MHIHLRRLALITAFTIGAMGVYSTPGLAMSAAQDHQNQRDDQGQRNQRDDQSQHPDYSNNSYYRTGNREGLQDHNRNVQRTAHNHRYKSDDDKRAHDYGYQQGWQGQNYHDEHREAR